MTDNELPQDDELAVEFEARFVELKKELKIKTSFENLDDTFFLVDLIQKEGYVTASLSRIICHRIVNTYMSWNNYLHGIVMPNPNYMISTTESAIFDEAEKQEIINLMTKVMTITSKNSLLTLENNKLEEGKFIDSAYKFWHKTFSPQLKGIFTKVNDYWVDKAKSV